MTISTTPRFGFKQYSAGTDPHPNRDEFNALLQLIENNAALFSQNVTASRPAAGKAGRYFWDSTVARLYYDDGAAWNEVTTNGGGGAGKPIVPATAGTEGTSARSARADHTHNLPLATASADGALSAVDKALLNTASAAATPSSLVKLDAAGRAAVATPAAGGDIANKSYVDAQRDTRALVDHQHTAADITSGTLASARLPNVTQAVNGAMLSADKIILDGATSAATPSKLVTRDAAGRAQFVDPLGLADAVTKGFLDAQIATRAVAGHVHAYSEITGKPSIFPTDWASVAGKPTIFGTNWASIADIPATFASEWALVAGKPAIFPTDWASVSGKPATFSATAHTHVWADLTDKPLTFAPAAHAHDWASITGKPAGYQPNAHTHPSSNINMDSGSNLQQDFNLHGAFIDDLANRINQRLTVASFLDRIDAGPTNLTGVHAPDWSAALYVGAGRVYSTSIFNYNVAYGSYRACWVNQDGSLGYNLSSRKYKTDERDYVVPLDLLKTVSPKWFKYKHDIEELGVDAAPDRVNFIAEDLHDAGLEEYVSYNDASQSRESAETINEQLMVNALWSFAQQQQELIEGLQKQITELKEGK